MAQKTLQAVIVLGGRVDNSFGQLGSALIDMGSTIDGVSQKLIDFGKDSVDVYRNYEDSMLDAQVALSTTYGRGTQELQAVMAELDAQATEWAATSIFHTNDVGNAIAQAAHAGWDLDTILSGIPAAMELAQAGGLDLSQSVDYIVKSANAAGISFEDMGEWIDEWTYAANRSAGDVESFGDAMLRMGSTMRFTSNKEELLTLIATMHDAGSVGAEAGTLIRNSLIRLIAPTDKAKDAFSQLGATSEETAGIMDEALEEAGEKLEEVGFNPLDEQGNVKPMIQIYRELSDALAEIAGGYENISSNGEALAILSAIFPTRTITGALAILNSVRENFGGLYDDLMGGKAEDYSEYAAETMMSGLTGAVETFGSKVERLKQLVGEELAPQVTAVTGWAGDFVDSIATLDDDKFSALVGGLEVVAGLGPGLMGAGAAFRLLGRLFSPAGAAVGIVLTASAIKSALIALDEAKFENKFGDMSLDTETLSAYVQGISDSFDSAYSNVYAFRTELDNAVTSYQNASTAFASRMLTDVLTKKELTEDDLKTYQDYGNQMVQAVKDGAKASVDESAEYFAALFSSAGQNPEYAADPAFQGIIDIISASYDKSVVEIEEIGQNLRDAITEAFNDGKLTQEEQEKIQFYFDQLNDAMARAQKAADERQDRIARRALLHKAQSLSYDEMEGFIESDIMPARESELAEKDDLYNSEISALETDYEYDMENETDPQKRRELTRKYQAGIAEAEKRYKTARAGIYADYDDIVFGMLESALASSDLEGTDEKADALAAAARGGFITRDMAQKYFHDEDQAKDAYQIYHDVIGWLGGEEAVQDRIAYYEDTGNAEMAAQMQNFYDKYGMSRAATVRTSNGNAGMITARARDWKTDTYQYSLQSPEDLGDWVDTMAGLGVTSVQDFFQAISDSSIPTMDLGYYGNAMTAEERSIMSNLVGRLSLLYDFDALLAGSNTPQADTEFGYRDEYAAWMLMNMGNEEAEKYRYGSEAYRPIAIEKEREAVSQLESELSDLDERISSFGEQGILSDEHFYYAGESLQQQRQEKQDELNEAKRQLEILTSPDEETKGELTEAISPLDVEIAYPNAVENAQDVHGQIEKQFSDITQTVTILTREISSAQAAEQITETVGGGGGRGLVYAAMQAYAEGGRATEASIFGEGPTPEWAIPEEHTAHTANLLKMAALASGFEWGELSALSADSGAESGGGASASSGGPVFNVEYSPVIHTDNAKGLERVLKDDKRRLKKMLEDLLAERELYESVVKYQ